MGTKKYSLYWLGRMQSIIGLIAIVVMAILLSPRAGDGSIIFLQWGNITDVLRQQSEIGIIALAMTFVILTGGIDLSVGSVLALSASIVAMLLVRWQSPLSQPAHIVVAVVAALIASTAVGVLNGLGVSLLRLQPFIITLATMIGVRGLARWMTQNTNIDFGFGHDVSAVFAGGLSQKFLVIGIFLALAALFALLLQRTVFGRHVRSVGDNELAARYSGVPIAGVKIWVYSLAGLFAGLAGVIHAARAYQGNPNDGVAYELDAIAAVVMGGTSLAGGKGSVFGTVVGTLIMGVLTNILRLKQIDANAELMIKALIIVAAVWAQQKRRGN